MNRTDEDTIESHHVQLEYNSPARRRTNARPFVADAAQIFGRFDQMVGTVQRLAVGKAGRHKGQHQLLVDEIRSARTRWWPFERGVGGGRGGVVELAVLVLVVLMMVLGMLLVVRMMRSGGKRRCGRGGRCAAGCGRNGRR